MFKASIIGGTGYGGAELCRQLLQHPQVELTRVCAIDNVGRNLGEVHYNLAGHTDLTFENLPPEEAVAGVDVCFLGLPHKVSADIAPDLIGLGAKIIDLSGDFRLRDAEVYARYYHRAHPRPDLLGSFAYGLPELNREAIAAATEIASPGCFATAITVGLLPFARAGLLTEKVRTVACTGSSGSGAYAKAGTHHPLRAGNLKIYRPLDHQHRPEIEQTLRDAGAAPSFHLDFVPVSAPLVRGILANSIFDVPAEFDEDAVAQLYHDAYGHQPFVKVISGRFPEVVAVAGTNYAEVGFSVGPARDGLRTVVAVCAIDNLVKGGAGQAVQSMNITLGLEEDAGLAGYMGIWP